MRKDSRKYHDREELLDSHSIFEDDEYLRCILSSLCSEGIPLGQVPQIILLFPLFILLLHLLVILELLLSSEAPLKE